MPGKKSRNKGHRLERELVNLLRSYGLDAKRVSMLESNHEDKGDVQLGDYKVEVKGGSHVPRWFYNIMQDKDDPDMIIAKRDRCKWFICMDFEKFLQEFFYILAE